MAITRGTLPAISDLMRDFGGRRLLLVDHQIQVRDTISLMLQALGAEVVQAEDAMEALSLYPRHPFDAVLADYDLPGMKGDELAEFIKSVDSSQRVILLTGSLENFLETCRVPVRFDVVLSKPCTLAQLSLALRYRTLEAPLPAAQ
jgi:CheY-like chemotaxis protein